MSICPKKKLNRITKSILIFFIIISAIFAISISRYIISKFRNNIKAFYGDIGKKVGNFLISQIDYNKVNSYVRTKITDEYYYEIEDLFKNTKEEFDVACVYLMVPVDEGMLYVWDVGFADAKPFDIDSYDYYADYINSLENEHISISNYKVPIDVKYVDGKEEYVYEEKPFAIVLIPYYFENDEIEYYVGVDFDMEEINKYIIDFSIKEIIIVVFIFGLQILLMILFVKYSVSIPLTDISNKLREASQKNSFSSNMLSNISIDSLEISNISSSLSKMSGIIEKYNANILDNLLDDTQANFAISTMRDLKSEEELPQSVYYDEDRRYKLCIHMEKVDKDNKDYYSYFNVGDNKVAFIVMESSEKSEAFSLTLDAISKYIKNKTMAGEDIGIIFTNLSRFLHMADWVGIYVNCCEIVIDFNNNEVQYVNAGQINSCMYDKNENTYKDLPFDRENALSAVEDPVYKVNHFKINNYDKIILYTSKLNELLSLKEDDYKSKEIVDYMNQNKSLYSKEIFTKMKDTIINNKNKSKISDMIFMIIEKGE